MNNSFNYLQSMNHIRIVKTVSYFSARMSLLITFLIFPLFIKAQSKLLSGIVKNQQSEALIGLTYLF